MKQIIVLCIFLSFLQVSTQAEYTQSKKSKTMSKNLNVESKATPLEQTLSGLTSAVMILEKATNALNDKSEFVDLTLLKKCASGLIEANITSLINVTVDLVFNVSGAVEAILDKSNECASEGFPKSISCFLQLVNTCKVDIDVITQALSVYNPLAHRYVRNIFSGLAEYSHSKLSKIFSKYLSDDFKPTTLKQHLGLPSGVIFSKTKTSKILDLSKELLRKCDYGHIEGNISSLVNVTVDLVYNVSGAVEAILDQINFCATEMFPTSLSCILQVTTTCRADIDEIYRALDVYKPVAHQLVMNVASDLARCRRGLI